MSSNQRITLIYGARFMRDELSDELLERWADEDFELDIAWEIEECQEYFIGKQLHSNYYYEPFIGSIALKMPNITEDELRRLIHKDLDDPNWELDFDIKLYLVGEYD